jgi:hypothetical protein
MTHPTRRTFVAATISTLTSAPSLLGMTVSGGFEGSSLESFEKHVGSTFLTHDAEGNTRRLTLVSATQGKHPMPRGIRRPISLLLRSHGGVKSGQDVYEVRHAALGRARALVVPVNQDGNLHEIVFG